MGIFNSDERHPKQNLVRLEVIHANTSNYAYHREPDIHGESLFWSWRCVPSYFPHIENHRPRLRESRCHHKKYDGQYDYRSFHAVSILCSVGHTQNSRYSAFKNWLASSSSNFAFSASQCRVLFGKRPAMVPNRIVSVNLPAYENGAVVSALPRQASTN